MKTRFIFIPLTLIIFSQTCFAEKNNFNLLKSEVTEFFKQYLHTYNAYLQKNDPSNALTAAAEDLYEPAFQITPNGQIMVFERHEQVKKNTQAFLNQFANNNVSTIDWKKLNIKILSQNSAVASNIATLIKKDGDIYQEVAATYLLHKSAKGWKIAVRTLHPTINTLTL